MSTKLKIKAIITKIRTRNLKALISKNSRKIITSKISNSIDTVAAVMVINSQLKSKLCLVKRDFDAQKLIC